MTSKGNSTWSGRARQNSELQQAIIKEEIRALNLRSALEFYGVRFGKGGAALCPFHKETNGSFRVKGKFWHCFSCSETGDLIRFVRKLYGMSYPDALDAICRDFGISARAPTPADRERLDLLRLKRYNTIKRYDELLNTRDVCTDLYLLAWDVMELAANDGGRTIHNDRYVTACFNLLRARITLDDADYACAEYLRDNPVATPVPPKSDITAVNGIKLPPAPGWRGQPPDGDNRAVPF